MVLFFVFFAIITIDFFNSQIRFYIFSLKRHLVIFNPAFQRIPIILRYIFVIDYIGHFSQPCVCRKSNENATCVFF